MLSAAFKQGRLGEAGYAALIETTTRLNRTGARLSGIEGVHAVTDVTGFGLLGHAMEMARGAGRELRIELDAVPLIAEAARLAGEGVRTGASGRNWDSYGDGVILPDGFDSASRDLLTDPQTSGGLLIAVAEDAAPAVLDLIRADGFVQARRIGRVIDGPPAVRVV